MNAVGIDVSKGKSTVTIRKPGDVVLMSPCDIPHTQSAINDLIKQIKSLEGETKESPFVIGFNGVYLAKVLPVMDDLFDIEMTNPTGAAVLTAEDVTTMVLPVRIKD